MLTVELLKQNTALSGLTDEQISAIAEMSKNDEDRTIGTRIGELHGRYDADILSVTGEKKNDGEKSYDYVKRVLGIYKQKADSVSSLEEAVKNEKQKVSDLQAKLESASGSEEISRQLKDARDNVTKLQAKLSAKEKELADEKSNHENSIRSIHVDHAFQQAVSGLKFKAGIPESAIKVLVSSAKSEVLAKGTPDFVDSGDGGKTLVFRDGDGNIMRNDKNNLNPLTVSDMLSLTSLKDVIDPGVRRTGGGTVPPGAGTPPQGSEVDLSLAKTQEEATGIIVKYLLSKGLTRDNEKFYEEMNKIWSDNEVHKLPLR